MVIWGKKAIFLDILPTFMRDSSNFVVLKEKISTSGLFYNI